jgi:hypothetical protein
VEGDEKVTMKKSEKGQAETYIYRMVDDREFIQRKLVLAQMEQLVERLKDVKWPDFGNFNLLSFYEAIGSRLPVAMAIILTEKGSNPKEKDIDALTDDMRFGLPLEESIRALKDFFLLNPTASIAASLRDLIGAQAAIKAAKDATGSQKS